MVLHIYGQAYWHCDARIVGTREDLVRLRDQLDLVLNSGHPHYRNQYFPADGEGYELLVATVTEETMAKLPHQCIDEVCGQWSSEEVEALRRLG